MENIYYPLCVFPVLSWGYYFHHLWKKHAEKKKQEAMLLKSNCVVMYARDKGMIGWPAYEGRFVPTIKSIDLFFEPILHFINASQKTVDIAMMLLTVRAILAALKNANARGVRIRIVVGSCGTNIKHELKSAGEVKVYIPDEDNSKSIFHNKFMIRDYKEDSGCVLCGSMNLTMQGMFNNYENIVITSNKTVQAAMNEYFEGIWMGKNTEHL